MTELSAGIEQIEAAAKKDWRDIFRGTVVTKSVVIGSHMVERQYHRQFITLGRNAHFISKIGRVLLPEKDVREAEDHVNGAITKTLKEIEASQERLRALATTVGIKKVGEKNGAQTIEAPLTSPIQTRFLSMLEAADDEINLLYTLWIHGEIPEAERTKREYELKKRIRAVSLAARNMFIGLRKRQPKGDAEKVSDAGDGKTDAGAAGSAGEEKKPAAKRKKADAPAEQPAEQPAGQVVA